MINKESNYDLIKFEDGDFSLDVKVSPNEDTVWLTQKEIALLFSSTKNNISMHITNIIREGELEKASTVKDFLTVQNEGDRPIVRTIKYYNLDMILSIGYRVKSPRGNVLRKWANSILKQYLLNGYAINSDRIIAYQSNLLNLEVNYKNIEKRVKNLEETVYLENNKLFIEGEIVEPYSFFRKLFFLAKANITITDYYADSLLISMLSDIKVDITIVTSTHSYLNKIDIPNNIKIIRDDNMHGRYIFIDDRLVYAIDNSFNAIGKKKFVLVKLENITKEMILKDVL